jgi:hypothetical protein
MGTDTTGNQNQPQGSDQEQPQDAGLLGGMLKGTVSSMGDALRDLVRSEVDLAKAELKQEAGQVGKAGGMIAGGGMLGITGFMFLMFGMTHLLAKKMPLWLSSTLVGSALIGIAGKLGVAGKTQLQETNFTPDKTIDSLKDVKDTVSDAAKS